MNREFFERKVRELSDDKLQDLLKLRYDANREIIDLAIGEAKKRGMDVPEVSFSADKADSASPKARIFYTDIWIYSHAFRSAN